MAWPFSGNSGGNKSADQTLSEERLKILANVAIEQVPFPEQGMLSEEDAWTISPGPTKARINSQQSVPSVASTINPVQSQPAAPAPTVDTSGLERLISSRLDMVEDVLRMVETRLTETESAAIIHPQYDEGDDPVAGPELGSGDRIITASGKVVSQAGTDRLRQHDEAPLVELYEAQALEANPFLVAPAMNAGGAGSKVGAPTIAALLLDNMSGMAATSFVQKAMESGMLSREEGQSIVSIVGLANPGDADSALNDHLPHKALLTFSALVTSWRQGRVNQSTQSEQPGMQRGA